MCAKIIEARVKQKKDTLANWNANTLVLLDGEQAFVVGDSGQPINFKIGDGTKRFSELPWWISYDQGQYVQVVGNALPTPTQLVGYSILGEGTYTHASGNVVVPDGHWGVANWDGMSWSFSDMGSLPEVDAVDVFDPNGTKAQSQKGVASAISVFSLTKKDAGYTEVPANTEFATELRNSVMTDTAIWHQDRVYSNVSGNLSTTITPGYIASVKKYKIPKGRYDFSCVLGIISGNSGLCLYDENQVFIKTVVSLGVPVDFNTEGAKYFTVTHRTTRPVNEISVKNNTVVYDESTVIFAKKSETPTNQDLQDFENNILQEISDFENGVDNRLQDTVSKTFLGFGNIPANTEFATELRSSSLSDTDIWHPNRFYNPSTGQLTPIGQANAVGFSASVKKYEIPEGAYQFTCVMQIISGTIGLCLYDKDDNFIKTVVSLMTTVVFNTDGAKYFTVSHRDTRPVNQISVKNNTEIELLEDPLFIPTSKENEFVKKGDIIGGVVFNRFSEVEQGDSFPTECSVGNFDLIRNTDVKSGDVYKDYNIKGQNFPPVRKVDVYSTKTLTYKVCDVDKQGNLLSVFNKNIMISSNLGDSWTVLATLTEANSLNWVFVLDDGELLILDYSTRGATPDDDIIGGVFKSSSNRTVFTKVFTYRNRYQYIVPSWGVDIVGNTIYFSEYGNSYAADTANDPDWNLGTKADATRIFKSVDNGNTFTEFVNLNNLTNLFPVNNQLHIHAIHWDKYWNRLWVTTGDGGGSLKSNKKLLWTDDNGGSWNGIDLSKYYSGGGSGGTPYDNLQGLSMGSTNDVLLIGADCWNNSIFRVSKRKRNEVYLEDSYNVSPGVTDDITYFTSRFVQYNDSPMFLHFGRGDSQTELGKASRHPKIVSTYNGIDFVEVWADYLSPQGCEAQTFRVWKIKGMYYIYIEYPSGGAKKLHHIGLL